ETAPLIKNSRKTATSPSANAAPPSGASLREGGAAVIRPDPFDRPRRGLILDTASAGSPTNWQPVEESWIHAGFPRAHTLETLIGGAISVPRAAWKSKEAKEPRFATDDERRFGHDGLRSGRS